MNEVPKVIDQWAENFEELESILRRYDAELRDIQSFQRLQSKLITLKQRMTDEEYQRAQSLATAVYAK